MADMSIRVPALTCNDVAASSATAPFDIARAWAELEGWERNLLPPDKMFGPKLGFCQSTTPGYWIATHWTPLYQEIVWSREGHNPHTVMNIFRDHLRGLLPAGVREAA